jgi:hypothetical protein
MRPARRPVTPHAPDRDHHDRGQRTETAPLTDSSRSLSGIKVAAFTPVIAGPNTARTLAEQGAEILHMARPENEYDALLQDLHLGFRSTWMDLSQPPYQAKALDLLKSPDVVVENFRGRNIANLGLTAEQVTETPASPSLNPHDSSTPARTWAGLLAGMDRPIPQKLSPLEGPRIRLGSPPLDCVRSRHSSGHDSGSEPACEAKGNAGSKDRQRCGGLLDHQFDFAQP